MYFMSVGSKVPKPRCLSPAANSMYSLPVGSQVPKLGTYVRTYVRTQAQVQRKCIPGLLVVTCLSLEG